MRILLVRHAIAVDPAEFSLTGEPDDARPLTRPGRRRMRRAARGLHRVVPTIDVLAASPLKRAQQTAEIIATAYDRRDAVVTLAALVPDEPLDALRAWLDQQEPDAVVALVGHEPHVSRAIAWLLTGHERAFTEMTKGGACLFESDAPIVPGQARLLWYLRAGQLRRLR